MDWSRLLRCSALRASMFGSWRVLRWRLPLRSRLPGRRLLTPFRLHPPCHRRCLEHARRRRCALLARRALGPLARARRLRSGGEGVPGPLLEPRRVPARGVRLCARLVWRRLRRPRGMRARRLLGPRRVRARRMQMCRRLHRRWVHHPCGDCTCDEGCDGPVGLRCHTAGVLSACVLGSRRVPAGRARPACVRLCAGLEWRRVRRRGHLPSRLLKLRRLRVWRLPLCGRLDGS